MTKGLGLRAPTFQQKGAAYKAWRKVSTRRAQRRSSCVEPVGLVALPHPVQLPAIDINLFWHAKYHRDPATRRLSQLMFESFAN